MSRYFVENQTKVIDIGCSQGTLLKDIKRRNDHAKDADYIGIEINDAFQKHWHKEPNLEFVIEDIRSWQGMNKDVSLATAIFTFQFIPERYRKEILQKIFNNLTEGGALIFSEKVYSEESRIQSMMEFMFYDHKQRGFTAKEILSKERQLRHMAKLTTEKVIIDLLRSIGFGPIQVFWRNFNFIGIVAIKPTTKLGDYE
jgi:tRNA (cmo5U34)-methyltransferase